MSLLLMSLFGSVMILAVVVLRALLMNRLPKKTFLVLWALVLCRLLIPFELPSPTSVYNTGPAAAEAIAETVRTLRPDVLDVVYFYTPTAVSDSTGWSSVGGGPGGSALWFCGALACAAFFLIAWVRCRSRFFDALPAEGPVVDAWGKLYHGRAVALKVSDRVAAPLTYGLARPVLLLPKGAVWESEEKLRYVLAHEAVHIRRWDALWKFILTVTLCLHWFNPLVWVMYLLANRDLELSCDEAVVRACGEEAKSAYAMTLIGMEARQSGLLPFTSAFSKSAIEQRVKAIMKLRKTTVLSVVAALVIVCGVVTVFATSAMTPREAQNADRGAALPGGYAQEHYPDLMALKFDGYEDLTIDEYRARIIETITPWDGTERELGRQIDRMTGDQTVWDAQYADPDAWFLMGTLRLTMMDGWQSQLMTSGGTWNNKECGVEFRYTITDSAVLTVRERDRVLRGYLIDSPEELSKLAEPGDYESALAEKYRADGIEISAFNYYIQDFGANDPLPTPLSNVDEPAEPRQNHATTDADYEKLLALRTDESLGGTVTDFNENLLRHMNDIPGFFDSYWAVQEDFLRGEGSYELTEEERAFLTLTLPTSNGENAAEVKTAAGYPTKPGFTLSYQRGENGETARLDCPMSYEILRPGQISVAERDQWLVDIHRDLTQWLDGNTMYELGKRSKEDVAAQIYRFTHTRDGDFAVDPADTESMTYTVVRDMYSDGENQLPVGVYETVEAYLDAFKRGDKEAALGYRYDDPDDPYRDELRGAFLESTDELNSFRIDGIEALGENLWQVNVTYELSTTGEQSVSNYVAYIDGSYWMILNSRNIPANLVPEGMVRDELPIQ